MTTYETYSEAKIANPIEDIYKLENGRFATGLWIDKNNFGKYTFTLCNPADECMSSLTFTELGHKFVDGDLIEDDKGSVLTVGVNIFSESLNNLGLPANFFILRAAALEESESAPTETPEQKKEREELEAGEKLWREFGYINPKYPTYESLKPDYKKCWILFAKKLSGKGD